MLARGDLLYDSRVQKEVQSLTAAGLSTWAVGIATERSEPGVSGEPWGIVMRVETRLDRSRLGHKERAVVSSPVSPPEVIRANAVGTGQKSAERPWAYAGAVGDLRHYAGRMRENRLVAVSAQPLRPRVVIACDLTMLYAGHLLKRWCGAHLIYDAHELWVDSQGEVSPLFRWLYTATERRLIGSADAVMTVNDALADELACRYAIKRPLVALNGPERCMPSGPVRRPLRVLFQGQYGANRGLLELIRAFTETGEDAVLTLQGFGGIEGELRALVHELGLEARVGFAEPCKPSMTVCEAANHDVGVISYRPATKNLALSSPVKLFDYLGAGLALVSTDLPVIRAIAGEDAALYVSEPSSAALAAAIRRLAANPEQVQRMKAASCARCAELLWEVQARPLVERAIEWTQDADPTSTAKGRSSRAHESEV